MSKVFITQHVKKRGADGELVDKFNLAPASRHGKLVVIFGHGDHTLFPESMRDAILRRLHEEQFDPAEDYILQPTGDTHIAAVLAGVIAHRYNAKGYRGLRYNRQRGDYDVLDYVF